MGLFNKKFCDICGEKIGMLSNKKVEDGNICKNCAKKLSPFFKDRKHSTLEQIKQQLAYREENERNLSTLNITRTIGGWTKIYVDDNTGRFIVTASSDWRSENPDIISFSQVTGCYVDIKEHRNEIYMKAEDGRNISYNPPRYETKYEFTVNISVNSPWFSNISYDLTGLIRPDSPYSQQYRELERQADEIKQLFSQGYNNQYNQYSTQNGYQQQNGFVQQNQGFNNVNMPNGNMQNGANVGNVAGGWVCSCGTSNTSNFCQSCGAKKPEQNSAKFCSYCGNKIDSTGGLPKFCPQCGASLS